MKKLITILLMAAGAASAQTTEQHIMKFPNGTEILFTDRPCQLGDGKFQDLKSALVLPKAGALVMGCWAYSPSRQTIELVTEDGKVLVLPATTQKAGPRDLRT